MFFEVVQDLVGGILYQLHVNGNPLIASEIFNSLIVTDGKRSQGLVHAPHSIFPGLKSGLMPIAGSVSIPILFGQPHKLLCVYELPTQGV